MRDPLENDRSLEGHQVAPSRHGALADLEARGRHGVGDPLLRAKVLDNVRFAHVRHILEPEFCPAQALSTNRSSIASGHTRCMKKFGDRIKELREGLELSQREVAEKIGITQEGISQLERLPNRVPLSDTVQRLAKFFQVDPEWLLTGKGQQSPISSLTPEESELILLFRALSPAAQTYVLGRAREVYRDEYDRKESQGSGEAQKTGSSKKSQASH